MRTISEQQAIVQIKELVEKFNSEFLSWGETTGCVANFSWAFDPVGRKIMVLQGVEKILYRCPPPGAKTLGDIVAAAEKRGTTAAPAEK